MHLWPNQTTPNPPHHNSKVHSIYFSIAGGKSNENLFTNGLMQGNIELTLPPHTKRRNPGLVLCPQFLNKTRNKKMRIQPTLNNTFYPNTTTPHSLTITALQKTKITKQDLLPLLLSVFTISKYKVYTIRIEKQINILP